MLNWKKSRFFDESYINIGEWDLQHAKQFPHCENIAADTETKLYYNNKQITDDEAYKLYKTNGQSWVKKNIEVKAYAFMIAYENEFVLFKNAKDFLTCCSMLNVKNVFWYNAKFDFAIFDYYMLTNGWKSSSEIISNNRYGKLPHATYQSLNGEFGQRYQLRIWQKYINRKSCERVHNFKMLDICNIFGGGLAKNLKDWDIKDKYGNDIRKLTMSYESADIESDINYLINDTRGLYYLSVKINETLFNITGFSLFKNDYITAGGLAKKTLLKFAFGKKNNENIQIFRDIFPLSIDEDKEFRENSLYRGGKCFVNPNKVGKVQNNIYKYDVNSMYPDKMRNMYYPVGYPEKIHKEETDDNFIYLYKLRYLNGVLKENKVPIYQDTLTGDYVNEISETEDIYLWQEELFSIADFYDIEYEIIYILKYKAKKLKGIIKYVDEFYAVKNNSKGTVKLGAKLLLNSAYGKLAQRIERQECVYELTEDGYVHLKKGEVQDDENGLLSVVVGSRITALSRVSLTTYIDKICKGNPKKYFCYCDTDSVHALLPFDDTDDKELGKMKFEGKYDYAIYLAPKSYLLGKKDNDSIKYEVHCKGVNTNVVENELQGINDFKKACEVFRPNRLFKCLCGLNVKGGKALIYIDKMIMNDKNENIIKIMNGDLEYVDYEEL